MSHELMNIAELAHLLRTTPAAIHQGRYRGTELPPAIRVGRRLLWHTDDVHRFLANRKEDADDHA